MSITKLFGNSPRMKIVEFFMDFPKDRFTIPELVQGIGMSRTTAFKIIRTLLTDEWIVQKQKEGKSATYQINFKNPVVKIMQKINSYESEKIAIKELQKITFSSFRKEIQKQLSLSLAQTELHRSSNQTQTEQMLQSISTKISKIKDRK